MAKKEKPIVTLTIHGIKNHDIVLTNKIAKWLRAQADWYLINKCQGKLANRLTCRYFGKERDAG